MAIKTAKKAGRRCDLGLLETGIKVLERNFKCSAKPNTSIDIDVARLRLIK